VTDLVKKYNLTIFGENYVILSDEPEERLYAAAQLVDSFMHEAKQKRSSSQTYSVAVLAALQLASKFLATKNEQEANSQKLSQMDAQINNMLEFLNEASIF
jgi:cell division protein ZapA (FtsZ GTPase activity inhibitor)